MSTSKFRKCLLCSLVVLFMFPIIIWGSEVHAQSQACQVLVFNPEYPVTASAGQTIVVSTTIGVSCGQWRTYYTARVDLVDRQSGNILSTSTFDIGVSPNVTVTVLNNATAPQTSGLWGLNLNLYIFEEGSMVTSSKDHPVNIQVGKT